MADAYTDRIAAFDKSQGLSLLADAIDEESLTIKGVSIATAGVEAIGHGEYSEDGELLREFWTDQQTLTDMLAAVESVGQPLKAKLEHGSGLMEIVGEFNNFRIDGDHLRADFAAYESAEGKDHLFTIAKRLSKQFGVSVTAILAKAKQGAIDVMRCTEILSADFVDEPAINAGLFSRKSRAGKNTNVSKTSLHMEAEEIKTLVEESMSALMAPMIERLSALEDGNKPDEEALAAETAAKEEMSQKLTTAETELSETKTKVTELAEKVSAFEKVAEDAKALGIKFGARLSANEVDDNKETFAKALEAKRKEGKADHVAISELREEKRELCELEAKSRGLPSINML